MRHVIHKWLITLALLPLSGCVPLWNQWKPAARPRDDVVTVCYVTGSRIQRKASADCRRARRIEVKHEIDRAASQRALSGGAHVR